MKAVQKRSILTATMVAALLSSCRTPREPREHAAEPAAPSAVTSLSARPADTAGDVPPPPPPGLEPLGADAPIVDLPVEGFRDAVVSVPLGAKEKRPVMVALHGNYDRPEWQCEVWREIAKGHPFILCPRGIPRMGAPKSEDRWEYGGLKKTEEELLAGLAALEKRFDAHVDRGPVLFTGFSLGAILGRHLLVKHAERFPRAVLTEGGYEGWSHSFAKRYREAGGERVLFACGQYACKAAAKSAARVLDKQQLPARVADGGNIGHTYDGRVGRAIQDELGWLLEGDVRWRR